jgi:hypothetical protein
MRKAHFTLPSLLVRFLALTQAIPMLYHSCRFWSILVDFGRFWSIPVYSGRFLFIPVDYCRFLFILVHSCPFLSGDLGSGGPGVWWTWGLVTWGLVDLGSGDLGSGGPGVW